MSEVGIRRRAPRRELSDCHLLGGLNWTRRERQEQLRRRAFYTSPELATGCTALVCVPRALFLSHLEEQTHRLPLAPDVSVSLTLAPAHPGKCPRQPRPRRHAVTLDLHHEARAFARRQDLRPQHSFAEQAIANLVDHPPRPIAGHDLVRLSRPLRSRALSAHNPQLQIPAMPRQVKRELRQIPRIHAKVARLRSRTYPIDWPIEELAAIANHKLARHRPIAQRPRRHALHQRLNSTGDHAWSRHCPCCFRRIRPLGRCRICSCARRLPQPL